MRGNPAEAPTLEDCGIRRKPRRRRVCGHKPESPGQRRSDARTAIAQWSRQAHGYGAYAREPELRTLLASCPASSQVPPHASALDADLAADTPRRIATLALVPDEGKIAVINARATPAVHHMAAAVIHLHEQIRDRTAFAARRQRFWLLESRHESPRSNPGGRARRASGPHFAERAR